jgi:hypothetical protein
MVRSFSKETSGTELVTGIVGTIDIGALLTKAIEISKEQEETQKILDQITALIGNQNGGYTKILQNYLSKDFSQVRNTILTDLQSTMRNQATYLRNQAMLALLGYGGSATMTGLYSKLETSFRGLSTLYDCTFGIQQEMLLNNAERYYNKTLSPSKVNDKEALQLSRWGYVTRSQWNTLKQEQDGITNDIADKLFATFYKQPNEYDAFNLWKRGIITQDQCKEIFKHLGYDNTYFNVFIEAYYHLPSLNELTRMADFVPMDTEYLGEALRKNGVHEADIPRLTTYLQRRPLREETRGVCGRLLFEYSNGRITFDQYTEALIDLGLLPTELDLYSQWGTMQYNDVCMDLNEDQIEQKCRKLQYETAEEICSALVALGLDETFCNLKSWVWYWQYIYQIPD